ncbi:hypothetical protein [Microcoleus asticus]|uniref:hypothetical protein n=1 Tax=Microcoleus asticus TaxID=2815231 RepID=UPI001C12F15C|nr:hypothetical protein [Microcoleus asticus]
MLLLTYLAIKSRNYLCRLLLCKELDSRYRASFKFSIYCSNSLFDDRNLFSSQQVAFRNKNNASVNFARACEPIKIADIICRVRLGAPPPYL